MGKPTICLCENKGADRLCSKCEADQRLCFRCTDNTIPLLSKSKMSSLYPSSVTVQPGLCRTWSVPKLLVFLRTGSYLFEFNQVNNTHTISHRINMDQKENLICLAKLIYYIVTRTLDMAELLLNVYNKQN